MSEWVSYRGEALGEIKFNDNGTNKLVYIAKGIDSLMALFRLNPDDLVETEGNGIVSFGEYKQHCLKDVMAFYPSVEDWFMKNNRARTLDDLSKELKGLKDVKRK